MNTKTNKHAFSIELRSKSYLSLDQPKDVDGSVLIEGSLGDLKKLIFVEGAMLHLEGTRGTLRLDITEVEWNHLLRREGST